MRVKILSIIVVLFVVLMCQSALAQVPSLVVFPEKIIQGEPFLVQVEGVANLSSIKKATFDGAALGVFKYQGVPSALVAVDLKKKPGIYSLVVEFFDGQKLRKAVMVGERQKIEVPLGIPKKLGGNTVQSQNKLVSTLAQENASLLKIRTGKKAFWSEKFSFPLKDILVTDEYGYLRTTGNYTIAHKGVDFHADEGTPVMAINRGVVRMVRNFRNYGKTIVVDHGLGLMSFYMHLSKIQVNEGELVRAGQIIGLSGQTGYAEKPHLHLTIRIGGISIDPIKFFELFK